MENTYCDMREALVHLDIMLLIVLAALAVWTELDKLRKRKLPE